MNRSQFEHLNAGQQYSHHTCSEYELAMHLMTLSPQAAGCKIKTVSTKSTQISQPHVDLVSAGSKPFVHAMYTRRKEVVKTALHYITSSRATFKHHTLGHSPACTQALVKDEQLRCSHCHLVRNFSSSAVWLHLACRHNPIY